MKPEILQAMLEADPRDLKSHPLVLEAYYGLGCEAGMEIWGRRTKPTLSSLGSIAFAMRNAIVGSNENGEWGVWDSACREVASFIDNMRDDLGCYDQNTSISPDHYWSELADEGHWIIAATIVWVSRVKEQMNRSSAIAENFLELEDEKILTSPELLKIGTELGWNLEYNCGACKYRNHPSSSSQCTNCCGNRVAGTLKSLAFDLRKGCYDQGLDVLERWRKLVKRLKTEHLAEPKLWVAVAIGVLWPILGEEKNEVHTSKGKG